MHRATHYRQIIAYASVKKLFGFATLTDIRGRIWEIKEHDVVLYGEQIDTGIGKLELALPNGKRIRMSKYASIKLNQDTIGRAL